MTFTPAQTGRGKEFPSQVDKSERGANRPEPDMLGRRDITHQRWTVEDCRPVRGEARTNIGERIMFAPSTDGELERVIRGHEMMHAKVSPTVEQMEQWLSREIASETALIVTEELRVNFLCQKAGFDVKSLLSDGSELATGEKLAEMKDWAGLVAMCIATAGTAGHKQFLNGVRRKDRAWGETLGKIGKRALREMNKAHKSGNLARTEVTKSGLAPFGFSHTERLAEWVDRLATFPPPPTPPSPKGKAGSSGAEGVDKSQEGEKTEGNNGEYDPNKDGDRDGNPHPISGITPTEAGSVAPSWAELRLSREPLPRYHYGSMGKRRVATNMGRRPRRIHRYMTDPAKRVFDKTIRGSGGMVIIDASGSMSFTTEQIAQIIDNAQGATVMIYSDRYSSDESPNAWVVADKGRMVENVEYIDYGHGNGVDFPAIKWGVENRQYKNTPLVWVTDGGVAGTGDGFSDVLIMQCISYARQNNYIVVPHIEEAIEQLRNLKVNGKAQSVYPHLFRETYYRQMGFHLKDD